MSNPLTGQAAAHVGLVQAQHDRVEAQAEAQAHDQLVRDALVLLALLCIAAAAGRGGLVQLRYRGVVEAPANGTVSMCDRVTRHRRHR